MNENRISIDIPQSDIDDINAAVQTIVDKLKPYLIALEAGDKQSLAKMRDKSAAFVEKAVGYMETNPEFTPPYLDKAEVDKDFQGFSTLHNILRPLMQIISNVEDTSVLCGSEAYTAALAYYNTVKQAARMNVPNAQAIYDDLRVRFEAQKPRAVKPKP